MEQPHPPQPPPPKPLLQFPQASRNHIDPYLTQPSSSSPHKRPFVTLTYAQSLDSKLSLAPGTLTLLSGPETKSMTHYLRSRHDAILIGVGTAVADNPALNCRIEGVGVEAQPRPIILDPRLRWTPETWKGGEAPECMVLAARGRGKSAWILHSKGVEEADRGYVECAERFGSEFVQLPENDRGEVEWDVILRKLEERGVGSVMIEGGAKVINTLLQEKYLHLIDTVIVTIAPVWLGDGGVTISPPATYSENGSPVATARLKDVTWTQFGQDTVMCGRIQR